MSLFKITLCRFAFNENFIKAGFKGASSDCLVSEEGGS